MSEQQENPYQSKINQEILELRGAINQNLIHDGVNADELWKEESNVIRDYVVALRDIHECMTHMIILSDEQKDNLKMILIWIEQTVLPFMESRELNKPQKDWVKSARETYVPHLRSLVEEK